MPISLNKILLTFVVALGLAIRLYCIHYGLPSKSMRLSTFHMDEPGILNFIAQWGSNDFITSDLDVPLLAQNLKQAAQNNDQIGMKLLKVMGKTPDQFEGLDKLAFVGGMNQLLRDPQLYQLARPDLQVMEKFQPLLDKARSGATLDPKEVKRLNLAILIATYPKETQFLQKWKLGKILYFHPGGAALWGGFHIYVVAAGLKASQLIGYLKRGSRDFYTSNLREADKIYLSGRFVLMIFGVLGIFMMYKIGSYAYDEWTGILAAFLYAISPAPVIYSVLMKADPLMMFFALCVLFFSLRIVKEGGVKNAVWAGIFLGFATGSKFNAAPYAVFITAAWLLSSGSMADKIKLLFVSGFVSLLAFCCASPFFVIEFPDLILEAIRFAKSAPQTPIFKLIIGPAGWINYATYYIPYALGGFLTAVCFASFAILAGTHIARAVKQTFQMDLETRFDLLFLLAGFVIYFATTTTRQGGIHYTLTLLPFLMIFAATVMVRLLRMKPVWMKTAAGLVILLTLGHTSIYAMAMANLYAGENVRETSSRWILENVPKGSSIAMVQFTTHVPSILRAYDTPYKLMFGTDELADSGQPADALLTDKPVLRMEELSQKADYTMLTEYDYIYYLHPKLQGLYPEQARVLSKIRTEMEEVGRFEKDAEFLGIKFPKKTPTLEWMNPNGTITFYKKREPVIHTEHIRP